MMKNEINLQIICIYVMIHYGTLYRGVLPTTPSYIILPPSRQIVNIVDGTRKLCTIKIYITYCILKLFQDTTQESTSHTTNGGAKLYYLLEIF